MELGFSAVDCVALPVPRSQGCFLRFNVHEMLSRDRAWPVWLGGGCLRSRRILRDPVYSSLMSKYFSKSRIACGKKKP